MECVEATRKRKLEKNEFVDELTARLGHICINSAADPLFLSRGPSAIASASSDRTYLPDFECPGGVTGITDPEKKMEDITSSKLARSQSIEFVPLSPSALRSFAASLDASPRLSHRRPFESRANSAVLPSPVSVDDIRPQLKRLKVSSIRHMWSDPHSFVTLSASARRYSCCGVPLLPTAQPYPSCPTRQIFIRRPRGRVPTSWCAELVESDAACVAMACDSFGGATDANSSTSSSAAMSDARLFTPTAHSESHNVT